MNLRLRYIATTFHFFAVGQQKSCVIFVPVLGLFEYDQEIFELVGGREMLVIVGVDDGVLRILLIVAHDVSEIVVLVVGRG